MRSQTSPVGITLAPKIEEPCVIEVASGETGSGKLLGMRKTTFFLSLALFVVILAGVIGGAVGGVLVHKSKQGVPKYLTSLSFP